MTAVRAPQASGLSEWMGKQMEPLRFVSPAAITLILSLVVAVFTECTSNVATTTLFLPILASMVSDLPGAGGPWATPAQEAVNPGLCPGSLEGRRPSTLRRPGAPRP